MKKIILIIGVVSLTAITFTGCVTKQVVNQRPVVTTNPDGSTVTNIVSTTNSVTTIDPVRTSNAIRAIVPPAVKLTITESTNARPIITDIKIVICGLASTTHVSPEDLKIAVDSTGIKSIQTPEIEAAIQTVYAIYSAYYGDVVNERLS